MDVKEMREMFEQKLTKLISKKKDNSTFLSSDQYKNRIEAVKEAKDILSSSKGKMKLPMHYWLSERFDIINDGGKEKLIKRITDISKPILFFVHQEELFDILHSTHLNIGHGGRNRMIEELHRKYFNITRETVMIYLSLCNFCQNKSITPKRNLVTGPVLHSTCFSRAQIDIIDMQLHNYNNYRFIMVHQDYQTKFVIIRALKTNQAEEVASHLLDIYTTFGIPIILQSGNGREFVISVITKLHEMWASVNIVHGKLQCSQPQGLVVKVSRDVESILATWMVENNTRDWPSGLKFVQFQKNHEVHLGKLGTNIDN
ncbi:PREDICTED: KRAB-A domain-containing protein 2-like [Polistes canadensis]|uniref:KRAB-A domain-containing protein 2-like n=1 Tax=Polistes canadensis TaxID=91411 RepID=UPI000718B68C|nr:PREDICTED: KRAB-A domain-containing protein 2-like [Polistes canadensis]